VTAVYPNIKSRTARTKGTVKPPFANEKRWKRGRMLVKLLGSMALAIWLIHFCLWYQYAGTRPRQPDAASGRHYALNTHGTIVYLNKREDANLTWLTVSAVSLFGIAFLVNGVLVDGFSQRRMPWEKKQS
jgi:hypothetical protein